MIASSEPVIPNFGHGSTCVRDNHTFCWSWVQQHWSDTLGPALVQQPRGGGGQNGNDNWHDHEYDDDYDEGDLAKAAAVGVVVGAAAQAAYDVPAYWTLSCVPTTVVVNGTTYYQCGTAWYVRIYSGGEVAYTMTSPPPGY